MKPETEQRGLASRIQFLTTHILVLQGPGPFTAKYLGLVADAIDAHRATNPETEALTAKLRGLLAKHGGRP